ncbi:MAG: hypothetical protein M3151_11660 [Actinomycetota bacterium]|nr:hypothetical protein [Actinomycetota bacterium]
MEQNLSGTTGQTGGRGGAVSPGLLNELLRLLVRLLNQLVNQANDLASRGGEQVKAEWDNQQGGEQIRSRLDDQKHQAAQRVVPVQTALRETAQQLRKQGQGSVAGYADGAAERVERFSGYLRETDVDEMVDEARSFARRRPALFLGSAATLGFLTARFLKSSEREGVSVGGGTSGNGGATSSAAVSHGTGEPATTLPPGTVAGSPTTTRTPIVEPPAGEGARTEPPRSEPPRGY